jgi:two-component system sensor histidine kinase DesK
VGAVEEAENVGRGRLEEQLGGLVWAAIWMWPVLQPISAVLHGKVHPVALAAAGLLAFIVLYLALVLTGFSHAERPPSRWTLAGLAVLAVLGPALTAAYIRGQGYWLTLMLYVGAAGASVLPRPVVFGWSAAVVTGTVALGWYGRLGATDVGSSAFTLAMVCALVIVVKQMMGYIHQLRQARDELARAAVAEERLRFARDLHDLLGHTLSVMVVKAEVVRRLAGRDPTQASAAAADIEELGRTALSEVRDAVAGYRSRPFAAELDGAREALSDAGIEVVVEEVGTPLPAGADVLFGWAVREGATNVIRHSRATRCWIVVRQVGDGATLEIRDDGVGGLVNGTGHGLRGLRERLSAAGGTLTAGTGPDGGFRLLATVPGAS